MSLRTEIINSNPNLSYGDEPVVADFHADYPRPHVGAEPFPTFHLEPSLQIGEHLKDFEVEGDTYVTVYHGSDPKNYLANKIEVSQMVQLGDLPEESEKEFQPYFNSSFLIEVGDAQGPLGVLRIIPYGAKDSDSSDDTSLKTFRDISTVTGDPQEIIEKEFMKHSGCEDLSTVFDVTTLALAERVRKYETDPDRERRAMGSVLKKLVMHNMLIGLMDVGFELVQSGELTHMVSENEPRMHGYLVSMGYPMQDLNGYGDVFLDLAGKRQAMTVHPAWFSAVDLERNIKNADPSTISGIHLAMAARALRALNVA